MFPRRPLGIDGGNGHGRICPYGLGKDSSSNGGDPTQNVLDLVRASIERVDDLRDAESRHQHEVARLLTERVESMMTAESKRIDAIRAVDVDAVRKDSMASAVQAQTLAAQVSQTAEAMRTQVAATASAPEPPAREPLCKNGRRLGAQEDGDDIVFESLEQAQRLTSLVGA